MRSVAAVLAAPLLALVGCGPFTTRHQVLQDIPSPSGEWKAVVTTWEPPGGALADTQYSIHVVRAADPTPIWLKARGRARALWFSEHFYPRYLFWRDDRNLELVVDRPDAGEQRWFRDHPGEFRIAVRATDRIDKQSLAKLDELPIVRAR